MPELAAWAQQYGDLVTIRVISRGDAALNRAMAEEHGLAGVLVQRDREVARLYGASATPSAVLVGTDGRVAGPLVAGGVSIWRLLLRAPRAVVLEASHRTVAPDLQRGRGPTSALESAYRNEKGGLPMDHPFDDLARSLGSTSISRRRAMRLAVVAAWARCSGCGPVLHAPVTAPPSGSARTSRAP